MANVESKVRQRDLWNRMAGGWVRQYNELERLSRPVNEWLCKASGLKPGMRVLDIASGSGQPAFMAAQCVQAGGNVVATDISSEMVEALRQRAEAEGVDNLEAREADMDDLPFEDESFDAITCRWGYMFSDQPQRAFSESRRVLRPGGVLATATWDGSERVPLGSVLNDLLNEIEGKQPRRLLVADRLDTVEKLESALDGAGFRDVAVEQLSFDFDFPSSQAWWEFMIEMATPVRGRLDALSSEQMAALRSRFEVEAEKLRQGDRIMAPAVCLCAVATK